MRIGLPKKSYASRSRFSRNRSYEKCSFVSAFVNNTNVGGALVDHLEQFRRAFTGGGGDVEDRRVVEEFQVIAKLLVPLLRGLLTVLLSEVLLHQVPFVGGDDDAFARILGGAGDRAVLIGRSHGRIEDEHDH